MWRQWGIYQPPTSHCSRVYKKNQATFQDIYLTWKKNTIIDPIIYFKECNSSFFVPLHDGWHLTSVNSQLPSGKIPFALPLWDLSFVISQLGFRSHFPWPKVQLSLVCLAALNVVSIEPKTSKLSFADHVVSLLKYQASGTIYLWLISSTVGFYSWDGNNILVALEEGFNSTWICHKWGQYSKNSSTSSGIQLSRSVCMSESM